MLCLALCIRAVKNLLIAVTLFEKETEFKFDQRPLKPGFFLRVLISRDFNDLSLLGNCFRISQFKCMNFTYSQSLRALKYDFH